MVFVELLAALYIGGDCQKLFDGYWIYIMSSTVHSIYWRNPSEATKLLRKVSLTQNIFSSDYGHRANQNIMH
jgi:hypothetical protein